MTKKPYIIVAVLLVLGIALSLLLIPKNAEIALMQMKDKHFEEALTSYEKQKAEGSLTVDVVSQLSELYLQKGSVDKAIEIMEAFVAEHPAHLEARNRLGRFYQYAQRNEDYLRNLEEINRLTPSTQNLKELSDIYNFNAQYGKQADTLKELIVTEEGKDAKHFLDRANILASEKNYPEAVKTLQDMKAQHPDFYTYDAAILLVSLQLDQQQYDEALKSAQEWQAANPAETAYVAKLVNMLHFKGNPDLASALIAAYTDQQINDAPALLQEYVLLQIAYGKEDEVYARLKALEDAGKLSPELKERLVYLALTHGDTDVAHKALSEMDLKQFNETQLSALVELGTTHNDTVLLKRLRADFPDNATAADYPVLNTLLALALKEPAAKARTESLAKLDLSALSSIQVARAAARAGKPDTARLFLKKLPKTEDMTDAELASAADIYLDLKDFKGGQQLLETARDRDSRQLQEARLKFAAALGQSPRVEAWLENEGKTAAPRLYADLFFLAYNNNQLALATIIAEKFHAREDSRLSRSVLAQVYIKTGQYKDAVALLRENTKRTPDDENNYLFALAKLSGQNPEYRKELGDYAAKRLRADLPEKEKMGLVYALVTAKQIEPAMPYIRELALKNGGQWAALYAEQLDKQGRHDEARAFWVKLASQPGLSAKERRSIAHNLLSHGYVSDAEPIFYQLAQNASADSQAVSELLYIWGPRPADSKVDWMADRMQRADSPAERERWAQHIANSASDEEIQSLAMRSPLNVRSNVLADRYVAALAHDPALLDQSAAIEKQARDNGRTDLLLYYARALRASGHTHEARLAYDTLYTLKGNDLPSLREAGIVSYAEADYTHGQMYLGKYMEADLQDRMADAKSSEAYFTYAEMLRRDQYIDGANVYYNLSLDHSKNAKDPETLSRRAQALVWTGHTQEGLAAFHDAMARYPKDDGLRADYAATLIELKDYNAARKVLSVPPAGSIAAANDHMEITLPATARASVSADGNEAIVRFNDGNKSVDSTSKMLRDTPGIAYTSDGYDSLLVGAGDGQRFETDKDTGKLALVADTSSRRSEGQMMLRYQLLAARVELETGRVHAANKRIEALLPHYPQDAQLLGFAANAENYGGNWPRAQQLLARANALSPDNEDILKLDRDMRREHAPGVKLDEEWISRGNDDEFITTLSGYGHASERLLLGLNVQNDRVLSKALRRADGRIANFSGHRQRGEIYGVYGLDGGQYLTGSLYANNDTLGAGAGWHFLNPLGETLVEAQFHRPYWEFTESVLDDTTRDYVGFTHTIKPLSQFVISGGPGYYRYNVEGTNNVFSAAGGTLAATYRLMDAQPFWTINYGFDAEYEISHKKNFDAQGGYTPMSPLRTREVHFFSTTLGYDFDEATYGDMVLGYGWDRFGGNGPSVEGRITHEFTEEFDAQLRASYGFDNGSSNDSVTRAGGFLRYKY